MTNWRIQMNPNRLADGFDDEGANLDDGNGLAYFRKGWVEAWAYIGGNAVAGDTVTVLEPEPDS